MSAPRAYKLLNEAIQEKPILCPEILQEGKLHPLVAFQYRKGESFSRIGGYKTALYCIEVVYYNEKTDSIKRLTPFTTIKEEAALKKLSDIKEKFSQGPFKRGKELTI